jgi:hypothetical protein
MAQRNPSEFWATVVLTVNTARGTRAMVERDVAEAAWLPAIVPHVSIR